MRPPAALHLAPHPDDELIGAPATLMALRDAGWRIVNLACGLGRAEQRRRREAELREACRLAGFELRLAPTAEGESGPAKDDLRAAVAGAIEELAPAIVIAPSPLERHPAHVRVAGVAREVVEAGGEDGPRWWMWGVWGPLPLPNLATAFSPQRLGEILAALSAHRGELARNDYRRLVRGRAEANACLAPELLFGFGSGSEPAAELAELLTEVVPVAGGWRLGRSRWLDPAAPLAAPTERDATPLTHPAPADESGEGPAAADAAEAAPGEAGGRAQPG